MDSGDAARHETRHVGDFVAIRKAWFRPRPNLLLIDTTWPVMASPET